jgi:hypothetical protein
MIIGIGHRSGHGKDTCAKMILDWCKDKDVPSKNTIYQLSFAWKLKDICYQVYGWAGLREAEYYDTDEGRTARNIPLVALGLTPVEIWVLVGEKFREVYPRTWVSWVQNNTTKTVHVICPDCRHPNEMDVVDYAIKVHNPRVVNREGLSIDDMLESWNGWDAEIINDGTLEELREKVNALCSKLFSDVSV